MTKEKQIEEMAISLRHDGRDCESTTCLLCHNSRHCFERKLAEAVISKGYRKASEVAREIFEEIEKEIKNHGICYAQHKIAELKKKYTEDEK